MKEIKRKDSKNRVLKEGEYQRENGSYEFKWHDKCGKRHSVYAKSLEELREKELDVLKDIVYGIKADGKKLTINDLYTRWCELKRGLKDNTFQNYKYMYETYAQDKIGRIKIVDVKKSDIRGFYNNLVDEQHIKVRTVECLQTVLFQIMQLAVDDEYIRFNPCSNALKELKAARSKEEPSIRALTLTEQRVFESFIKDNPKYSKWYGVFTTMLNTGMRIGEVAGLRWSDIDFENNTISINHTLVYYDKGDKCGFAINTPKTEAGNRVIRMLPVVREALLFEKNYQEEAELKCCVTIDGFTDFVFVNKDGGAQHQGTLNKALKRIIRDCNYDQFDKHPDDPVVLPYFSNHALRHTFATRMVESGANVKAIQGYLGHANFDTTMDIYAESTQEFEKNELLKVGQYLTADC